MIKKGKNFYLYGIFAVMLLWDSLDSIFNNLQFLLLAGLLLIYIFQYKSIRVSGKMLLPALVILLHGLVNIAAGNNSAKLFLIQFISVSVSYIVYANLTVKYSLADIFKIYYRSACVMSFIGILELIAAFMVSDPVNLPILFTFTQYHYRVLGIVKLASLCAEPSFLGYYLAPAVCLVVFRYFNAENMPDELKGFMKRLPALMIVVCYLLTFSMVSYAGMFVIIMLIWWMKGISMKKALIPAATVAALIIVYTTVPDINVRVNDTLEIFTNGGDGQEVNLSTFTYYSNFNVMRESLRESKLLGFGLGSYPLAFDRFSSAKWGSARFTLNREDGNSMFFRIITELGLPGILAAGYYIMHCFVGKKSKMTCYSCAIFTLLIMLLIRQGNYTHGGCVLFIYLYYRVFDENRRLDRPER